jgi:hypothetical protein
MCKHRLVYPRRSIGWKVWNEAIFAAMKAGPPITADMTHNAVRLSFCRLLSQGRIFDGSNYGQGAGYSFTSEFHGLIVEPLCLGYGCQFGLGLFFQPIVKAF